MRALLTAWALPSAVVVAGVVGVPEKVVYAVCRLAGNLERPVLQHLLLWWC